MARFQVTYTASGQDVDLRRTWRGGRRARRLADALLAGGFVARAKPDDAAPRMVVQAVDRGENARLVAYVAHDGALVTGEIVDGEQPQAALSCLMRMLNVLEAATGWTSRGRAGLDAQAAELSVERDGTVTREATLSESALDAAIGELLSRLDLGPGDERPRPGVDDVLASVHDEVVEQVPPGGPFSITWAGGLDGDFHAGWLEEGDDRSLLGVCEPAAVRGLERLRALGSEATGWPLGIGIARSGGADPTIEVSVYFDRIPTYPDGQPVETWPAHVLAMARRSPPHRPPWIDDALDLVRRTGRRPPDPT